jgi:hypothetical protein
VKSELEAGAIFSFTIGAAEERITAPTISSGVCV